MITDEPQKKVLLMLDDDPEDALLVETAVKRTQLPLTFQSFQSGTEFLGCLHGLWDAGQDMANTMLLLDLNMPGKSGSDWLRELRAQRLFEQLVIVIFSTSDTDEERAKSLMLGADAHVGKPDSVNELTEQLRVLYQRWLSPKE